MATIHVELWNAATQTLLGEVDLPAEQLPESFEASTTLHLGDADWSVVAAVPTTRAEYVASGRLKITMNKISYVDPKTLLYSLPTLENTLPPTRPGTPADAVSMHEDDWRQRELVALSLEPEVALELDEIRAVYEQHRKGAGFTHLHVRARVPEPLPGISLTLDQLRAALGGASIRPVVVGDATVRDGFAIPRGAGYLYGCAPEGKISVLALSLDAPHEPLVELLRALPVLLVDWCRVTAERVA